MDGVDMMYAFLSLFFNPGKGRYILLVCYIRYFIQFKICAVARLDVKCRMLRLIAKRCYFLWYMHVVRKNRERRRELLDSLQCWCWGAHHEHCLLATIGKRKCVVPACYLQLYCGVEILYHFVLQLLMIF